MTKDEFIKKWCPCTASGNDDDCRAHHLRPDVEALIAAEVRRLNGLLDKCNEAHVRERDEWHKQCNLASEAQADGLSREAELRADVERLRARCRELSAGTPRGPELDAETKREGE